MKCFSFKIIVIALLLGAVFPVSADPTKILPMISLKQEYSDNILFSSSNEKEDFITTASGGLAIRHRTETVTAGLAAWLDQLLYQDFDELNTLNKRFSGNMDYRVTERLGVGASAQYNEDSRRDRDADTTGLLLSGDREATRFSLSSGYYFSEILKGDIRLDYGDVEIKESNRYEDNNDFRADITFSKNLSEIFRNTTGILNFNYLRYTADIEATTPGAIRTSTLFQEYVSDIFQFSTGVSKDITELYNIYGQVGASYARTNERLRSRSVLTSNGSVISDAWSPDQDGDILGGVLLAGVKYNGLYYDMGLSVSQDMRGASGTNGAVQRSSVAGNIIRKLTEKFSLTFEASVYLNQNDRKSQADTEELAVNIQPGFRYQLSDDLYLSGLYSFTSVENRQDGTTSERNLIYIVIRKEFEL